MRSQASVAGLTAENRADITKLSDLTHLGGAPVDLALRPMSLAMIAMTVAGRVGSSSTLAFVQRYFSQGSVQLITVALRYYHSIGKYFILSTTSCVHLETTWTDAEITSHSQRLTNGSSPRRLAPRSVTCCHCD